MPHAEQNGEPHNKRPIFGEKHQKVVVNCAVRCINARSQSRCGHLSKRNQRENRRTDCGRNAQ